MSIESPHRRWNPLREEWVLNSPHRMKRPWQGRVEPPDQSVRPTYDPQCYLCPGNSRAGGIKNPDYTEVFAFTNDFAALLPEKGADAGVETMNGIVRAAPEEGICRVLCFSPRHDRTLAEMEPEEIERVFYLWRDEYDNLSRNPIVSHVMTFENKGELMGASNPHPHGQIWATSYIPTIPRRAVEAQERYFTAHGTPLLADYCVWEIAEGERIVSSNDEWVAVVPYWAVWPFEVMILPKKQTRSLLQLSDEQFGSWSVILKDILVRYDNLFQTSFPYSMGLYQQPTKGVALHGFTLHQSFFPPLLRSASVRKFMVGFELCAEAQRDITPEVAAAKLRECGGKHYRMAS